MDVRCGNQVLHFSQKIYIMGILNVTPDSFYDGGKYFQLEQAVNRAIEIEKEGADIIDIGGESTRPGAESVSEEEEIRRVIPVIEALQGRISIPISIDTRHARVAEMALQAGAKIINDVGGFQDDPKMVNVAEKYAVPLILMHKRGNPKTMQLNTEYADLIGEIHAFFENLLRFAEHHGILRERIILDPGIGFGKKPEHNLLLIRHLQRFSDLGRPLLVGVSRKSFIQKILHLQSDEDRIFGTASAVALSVIYGARMIRVHDVKPMVHVVRMAEAIQNAVDSNA